MALKNTQEEQKIPFFADLREKQSRFYQRLWQEISEIKIIDTHEHFWTMKDLPQKMGDQVSGNNRLSIPGMFYTSYIYIEEKGNYRTWAEELRRYRGTGYIKSWLIAMEDLYELEGPITPKYLEKMEHTINDAYRQDFENDTSHHLRDVLDNRMHVERAIVDMPYEDHLGLPKPVCQGTFGIEMIVNINEVPKGIAPKKAEYFNMNTVFWHAQNVLKMSLGDIQTFDDYLELTVQFLEYLKNRQDHVCLKSKLAYLRPISFPEPQKDRSKIAKLFNKPLKNEKDLWRYGDFMMHFILDWMNENWHIPIQMHTGLARIYDKGSDAIRLSNLFLKYPELHFDLFHGNYPYGKVAGMLIRIPNISANLNWLPIISPTIAQQTLTELYEVGGMCGGYSYSWRLSKSPYYFPYHEPSMRTILFGGDCDMVEGSYGALQIAKDVLIRSLEDLKNRGLIYEVDAIDLAEQVLYSNPKRIYGF